MNYFGVTKWSDPSRARRHHAPVFAAALALGMAATSAVAQTGPMAPTLGMADGLGGVQTAGAVGMMARAQTTGRIVVIVGVDAGFQPEGGLDVASVAAQRSGIASAQDSVVSALSAPEGVSRFSSVPYISMAVTPDDLQRLLEMPGVTSIIEDVPVPPLLNQSVPIISGNAAHTSGFTGDGWTVAVLDTGVQINHNAFIGAIETGACFSSNYAGISESFCPNGQDSQLTRWSGQPCEIGLSNCDHGTHVAGIAMGDRARRIGVAPDANLIPIQVFSRFIDDGYCGGVGTAPCVLSFGSDQTRGLERVFDLHDQNIVPNIASANMSIGGGTYTAACDGLNPALTAVIENLRSVGIATVIASGNNSYNGSIGSPACISAAVTVGSTTKTNGISSFSNHARMVDLLAPGSSISAPRFARSTNRIITFSGTSMATPHVAGAFAVLRQAQPDASVSDIEQALACTGPSITRDSLPRTRINVQAARRFLEDPDFYRSWNFRSDRQVRQWDQHLGQWFRPPNFNRLRVRDSQDQIWYAAGSPFCSHDVIVSVNMRRLDPETTSNWNSGVMLFASIDDQNNASGLWFGFNKLGGGQAAIWAIDNLNLETNSGTERLLCESDPIDVNVDGFNRLYIVSQGGEHVLFVNGSEVCSATDTSFTTGNVVVAMATPAGVDVSHSLDVDTIEIQSLLNFSGSAVAGSATGVSASGGAVTAVPTNLGAYQRAPEGGSLAIPSGMSSMSSASN